MDLQVESSQRRVAESPTLRPSPGPRTSPFCPSHRTGLADLTEHRDHRVPRRRGGRFRPLECSGPRGIFLRLACVHFQRDSPKPSDHSTLRPTKGTRRYEMRHRAWWFNPSHPPEDARVSPIPEPDSPSWANCLILPREFGPHLTLEIFFHTKCLEL